MKKQNKLCISFIYFITAALVALVFFFGITTGANTYAADNAVSSFDDTDVVEDLKAANFNLENYTKNSDGSIQAIYFVEYGYNARVNEQENYALYIYVYNPAEIVIDLNGKNFVQLSSKRDASGKPTDYSKYSVKCVSKSSGVYGKLFYKFKVVAGLSEQLAYVDDDVRRYDVSGIELQTAGEANATEYPISTTFYYSGYAKGFGKDTAAESTLACRTESIDTIGLEVKHTTYKFQNDVSSGQEIASVYFKVPKKYFDTYDGLQRIKAEWLKAVTKDIIVTNDKTLFSNLKNWIGKKATRDSMKYAFQDADSFYSLDFNSEGIRQYNIPWAYNMYFNDYGNPNYSEVIDTFYWLFYGEGDIKDVYIPSSEILDFYNKSSNKNAMLKSIDKEKTVKEIDADDAFSIEGLDKNSIIVNWLTKLLYPDIQTSALKDISPIKVLTKDDVKGLDTEIAERLYVNKYDVTDIKESVKDTECKTVLFRFAYNEYLTKEVTLIDRDTFNSTADKLYRNRLPMYLDFDIIWLGFQKGDKLTIIPAVSSPANIIGGSQPPVKDVVEKTKDWLKDLWNNLQSTKDKILNVLKWVGIALGSILVVLLLYIVIKAIVKACNAVSKKRQNNRYTKK